MDSFTGLNISRARNDIIRFSCDFEHIRVELYHLLYDLCSYLGHSWAGPNAVNFASIFNPKIDGLFVDFANKHYNFISGAQNAVNTLAKSLGVQSSIDLSDYSYVAKSKSIGYLIDCKEDIDGVVGMDTKGVILQLDIVKTKAIEIVSYFDNLPKNISFYDPTGDMVSQYNTNIHDLKYECSSLLNEMINSITSALESQIHSIDIAKQQAVDVMQS